MSTAAILTLDKTLEHIVGIIGSASREVKMDKNVVFLFSAVTSIVVCRCLAATFDSPF